MQAALCSEIIEDSNSAVPVVKLGSEYTAMRQNDVNDRCPGTAAANTDTPDAKETAPDAHVIGNKTNLFLIL